MSYDLTNTILSLSCTRVGYAAGVDISAAIELLQGIQNDATEAQNSNPPLHVDRDDDNLDFIISDDADESVLEEAFVCAGDGMVKDNNHTPNKVHDLQYPYG